MTERVNKQTSGHDICSAYQTVAMFHILYILLKKYIKKNGKKKDAKKKRVYHERPTADIIEKLFSTKAMPVYFLFIFGHKKCN